MKRILPLLIVAVVAACSSASSTRPASIAQPQIQMRVPSPIFFGSGSQAPVTIDVDIANPASVPITVRDIELSSPGMVEYSIYTARRRFNDTIAPGQSKTFTMFATAQAISSALTPAEPLTLRAIVEFQAEGHQWREIVRQQT